MQSKPAKKKYTIFSNHFSSSNFKAEQSRRCTCLQSSHSTTKWEVTKAVSSTRKPWTIVSPWSFFMTGRISKELPACTEEALHFQATNKHWCPLETREWSGVWHTIYHHLPVGCPTRVHHSFLIDLSSLVGREHPWQEMGFAWFCLKIKHPKIEWMRTSFSPSTRRKRTSVTTTLHNRSSCPWEWLGYPTSQFNPDGNSPCCLLKSC